MSPPLPPAPAHLEPWVRILGPEAVVEFLLAYGGGELYLPRGRPHDGVAAVVGAEVAMTLAQAADRLPRRVPTAKPWLAHVLRGRGLSVTEIARRLHVSDVAVRAMLRRDPRSGQPVPDGPAQPRLL
jgi:hypothetical protein